MRIILKPAGAALVLLAFGLLVFLLVSRHEGAAAPAVAANTLAGSPAAPQGPATPAPTADVQNPGFESSYLPIQPYDNKAVLSGEIASPWHDDSSWAHVTVTYAKDTNDPHSGGACQRIAVTDVQRAGNNPNAVQLVQPLALAQGTRYKAALWVRADKPASVEFSLREAAWPYTYYGSRTFTVSKGWQEITTEAPVSKKGDTFLMLKIWQPATIWVDDASISPVS